MKKSLLVLAALVSISTALNAAQAQVMQRRQQKETIWKQVPTQQTGIGFSSQFSNVGLNSLAVRHWLSADNAIEGTFGFAIGQNTKVIGLSGKYLGVIKEDTNLKFYGYGALGFENVDRSGASNTTVMLGGGLGWEFFIPGVNNLAFLLECGIGFQSVPDNNTFGTTGNWLNQVGIRYYL